MPVYNSELYIKEAIDSVLNQTFSDFEFIIIDDASTDKSVEIIKSYSDSRIQLIVKPQNSGLTNSLNYGISIARGEYIARMDSDDISLPERFEKQVAFLDKNNEVVVCGTAIQFINSEIVINNPEHNEDIKIKLLCGSCLAHPTVMMRKSVFDLNNILYNVKMETAEDYYLWVSLLKYGKLANLKDVLLFYRTHDNQVSNLRNELQIKIANICKIKMLDYVSYNFKDEEKTVINKLYLKSKSFSFDEIKLLLKIKWRIISKNNENNFFNKKEFLKIINQQEHIIFYEYFFTRKEYDPKLIIHFFQIIFQINYKLKVKQTVGFFIKSIISYKIKST
jgi:glycosyltransferase involved in cell wall biosynthesis